MTRLKITGSKDDISKTIECIKQCHDLVLTEKSEYIKNINSKFYRKHIELQIKIKGEESHV